MINLFCTVCFLSFLNTGLFLLAGKFGIITFYENKKLDWMPSCNFCLFFWMAFIQNIYLSNYEFAKQFDMFFAGSFFAKIYLKELCTVFIYSISCATLSRKLL